MQKIFRFQLSILFMVVISFAVYAFAFSETDLPGSGGEGGGTIGGWVVSNIQYRLAENPSKLSAIEFDLDQPVNTVRASVSSSNQIFFDCFNTSGLHWICNTYSLPEISSMAELRVVAAGGG